MEVADNLRDHSLDAEERASEEVVNFYRLILEEPLRSGIVRVENVPHARLNDHVVDAGVSKLGDRGILFDPLEVVEKSSPPLPRTPGGPVFFD
ncbi:hypothetical protein HRbin30_02140 [bacterium HR30]|nr:hypothetical protein HRbin30_02140 [bacterium HR30]